MKGLLPDMHKKTLRDIEVTGKQVLVSADYNLPFDINGRIEDLYRLQASLPTLRYLLDRDCRVVIISHLGRPHGRVRLRDPRRGRVLPPADRGRCDRGPRLAAASARRLVAQRGARGGDGRPRGDDGPRAAPVRASMIYHSDQIFLYASFYNLYS